MASSFSILNFSVRIRITFEIRVGVKDRVKVMGKYLSIYFITSFGRDKITITTWPETLVAPISRRRMKCFYVMKHSTHFINGFMEGRKCFI